MRCIKILILFLTILCVTGCSSSGSSDSTFNPPSWIQGSWVVNSGLGGDGGYKFTSDNIYLIAASELIEYAMSLDPTAREVSNTDNDYSFELTLNDELTVTACTPGSSATEIDCTVDSVTTTYTSSNSY
ncbi:MAG: hypothetical protein VXX85_07690 [Candidatus Margulisiibacteriota bacterium]|nr:hypothetical protein [Candidatus Margulisiibacteriota bacterium]